MRLPLTSAYSRALIELGRPMTNGIIMCGKTTTSRSGTMRQGLDHVRLVLVTPEHALMVHAGRLAMRNSLASADPDAEAPGAVAC